MEIRKLEIDFDKGILKINGKDFELPIIVTLPGPEGWPLARLFNGGKTTRGLKDHAELKVTYANNRP